MPLFVCTDCGTVDNTAMTRYWLDATPAGRRIQRLFDDVAANPYPVCSACDRVPGSKWHGAFPRRHWREWLLQNPDKGHELLNLRPCRCGRSALDHDHQHPQMPCTAAACAGYTPLPWPDHSPSEE